MTASDEVGVTAADCVGLWRRTLLVAPDGSRDTGTDVTWLQACEAFVDTRGFGGLLQADDSVFEWRRLVDLDAPGPPDIGQMHWERGILVETGVHERYVEHWVREQSGVRPCWEAQLSGPQGEPGVLLRVGDRFGFAGGDTVAVTAVGGHPWSVVEAGGTAFEFRGARWTVDTHRAVDDEEGS